jgi:hypothetical protein
MAIIRDFLCEPCNEVFEELLGPDDRFAPCPVCGQPAEMIISAPMIGKMNDPIVRNEALKKRSAAHTKREVGSKLEEFGMNNNRDYRKWKNSN